MLYSAPKGTAVFRSVITADEDRLLRAAFGRYGGRPEARAVAAPVVARHQQLGSGRWFLCDCLPGAERFPALVPVSQTHIRRHDDAPMHCETCDFFREPEEQRMVTASFACRIPGEPLRLTRPLTRGEAAPRRHVELMSINIRRPGLARLLIQLVTDAGLQEIGPGWRPPSLVDQVKAIWTAARAVEIDVGVPLPKFLCTSPAKLGELVEKIETVRPGRFTRTRPHGVLIIRAAAIGAGVVQPISGGPLQVRGRLAVFGERGGVAGETGAERRARAPYLVACIIGRAEEEGPVELLSAYAHPCVGDAHLMLVDSDMERRTLVQLRSVQDWLGAKARVAVSIAKPMHDIAGGASLVGNPRPPLIPDFVVRAMASGGPETTAIVETMGFAGHTYRARKERIHPLLEEVLGGAEVVSHDFCSPAEQVQKWRDERFWRELRSALTPSR